MTKPKILLVFTHRQKGICAWPRADFDYEKRKEELTKKLEYGCPSVDFVPATACSIEEAKDLVERSDEFDGFLVYLLGLITAAPATIVKSGKPVLLIDDLYGGSGEFLLTFGWARKKKFPVVGVGSSDLGDVVKAAKLFKVKKQLNEAKIILITSKDTPEYKQTLPSEFKELFGTKEFGGSGEEFNIQGQIDRIKKIFGAEVIRMRNEELNDYYESIPEQEAEVLADKWINEALRVVEPTRDEIVKSARMYLGIKKAMGEKKADAITIDCYRHFHELAAYPCMAYFQLNNEGLTGICEADLSSTITQLLLRYLTEEMTGSPRPGFVNDPVVNLASGRIIYAHCSANNKVFGPSGPTNPYVIRSHAETRKGVAPQSLMPSGEKVTTVQIHFMSEPPVMVIHRGRTITNEDVEEACRTKLVTEVNAEKIMRNWNRKDGWVFPANWHRVTIYGDFGEQLIDLANLMGMEVFEEDKALS